MKPGLPSFGALFARRNDVNVDANSARLVDNLNWHCQSLLFIFSLRLGALRSVHADCERLIRFPESLFW